MKYPLWTYLILLAVSVFLCFVNNTAGNQHIVLGTVQQYNLRILGAVCELPLRSASRNNSNEGLGSSTGNQHTLKWYISAHHFRGMDSDDNDDTSNCALPINSSYFIQDGFNLPIINISIPKIIVIKTLFIPP